MRTVLVHDYLTQKGGAERVVLEMARAFGCDTVVTSAYAPDRTYPEFAELDVVTLGLDRAGPLLRDARYALPILGHLFRSHPVQNADLVLCSSSGFAHQVTATVPKVVYCHNPPRWLHQPEDYLADLSLPASLALRLLRPRLLGGDVSGAMSATGYIANSRNVANRIATAYGIEASVVHPPRGLEPLGPVEPVPGLSAGFLLTVGRARGYKRTGLLMEAVAEMPDLTLVSVGSQSQENWPSNIVQLRNLSDAQLRWLYRSAGALLAVSHEDFGLTPVEAFAFGTPVGATAEGGYLETCVDGLTGTWLDATSLPSLQSSIRRLLAGTWNRGAIRRHGERWAPAAFHQGLITAVASSVPAARVASPTATEKAV